MKQLIPQSKIDEAANRFAEQRRLDSRGYPPKIWFESGVQFALNEIQPLVCEFIDWYFENLTELECNGVLTTQQLLEEFINDKNNHKSE